jgi:type I restriction enzyme S subunit
MRVGWTRKSLGEICEFVRGPFGGNLKKSVFVSDGFAVYEQQHAIYDQFNNIRYFIDDAKFQEMQRFELRPNDLIMSCSGTMGKVAIVPDCIRQGIINQALLKLTPAKALSPYFLKYWMDSSDFQDSLKEQSGGAAIQNVASVSILKEIRILLPPLPEQLRIVALLDEAFAGLATAKANAERNLQNARALFESHLQSVFSQRGEGWVEKELCDVCTLINGRAYKKDEMLRAGKYLLLRVGNFFSNRDWYYSDLELEADKYCDNGDLLYAWSASFGPRIWEGDKVIYHYHIWKVLPKESIVEKRFLLYLLEWDVDQIKLAHGTGTTMMHVSKVSMESRVVPIPPLGLQSGIVSQLDFLREETERLTRLYERKLAALEELKKSLLNQAFNGEL